MARNSNTKGETIIGCHLPNKTVLTTDATTDIMKKYLNSKQTASTIVTLVGDKSKTYKSDLELVNDLTMSSDVSKTSFARLLNDCSEVVSQHLETRG